MLYISSLCSSKDKIADAIVELAELGFTNIELTGKTKFYNGIEEDLIGLKDRYKLNYLIHNYFPPQKDDFVLNIATNNRDLKEKTLGLIKQAIALTLKFKENVYSIHPGFRYDLLPELEKGFFIKQNNNPTAEDDFYKTLDFLVRELMPEGFKVAVENLSPQSPTGKYSFLCTPEDIVQFLQYYDKVPNIGVLLDIGHLNIASNYLNFDIHSVLKNLFTVYADRIHEIHLSENDGKADCHNMTPIDSWQIELLYENRKMLNDKPIVLEWHNSAIPLAYERFKIIRKGLLR